MGLFNKQINKKLVQMEEENYNNKPKKNGPPAFLIVIGILLLVTGFSWAVICGLIYLICSCFGLTFSLKIATGIWAVVIFISLITNIKISFGNKN